MHSSASKSDTRRFHAILHAASMRGSSEREHAANTPHIIAHGGRFKIIHKQHRTASQFYVLLPMTQASEDPYCHIQLVCLELRYSHFHDRTSLEATPGTIPTGLLMTGRERAGRRCKGKGRGGAL